MTKAQTGYTSRKLNKAAHDERKAARMARHQKHAFARFMEQNDHSNIRYVNVSGITMPVSF